MSKNFYITLVLVALVIFLSYEAFNLGFISNKNDNKVISVDSYLNVKSQKEYIEVLQDYKNRSYQSAYLKSEKYLTDNNSLSQSEKDVWRLTSAASLIKVDLDKGSEYYLNIYNDPKVSDLNKSYALSRMMIRILYQNDFNISSVDKQLSLWGATSTVSTEQGRLEIYKKAFEVYPFGWPAARAASSYMQISPSTTTAQFVYNLYLKDMDSNISEVLRDESLRILLTGTYVNKALSLIDVSKFGLSSDSEIRLAFDNAYKFNTLYGDTEGGQYVIINYIDYLLSVKDIEKADLLFTQLKSEELVDWTVTYLSNKENQKKYFTHIKEYSVKNPEYKKYFSQFGL